jgi:aldose 1-epimerase
MVSAVAVAAAAATAFGVSAASAAPRAPARDCGPSVSKPENFGSAFDLYANKDLPVYRYTLSNCNGMTVRVLTYGGIIQSISVPDRYGHTTDVVLGFKTLQDYVNFDSPPPPAPGGPYFGETVGRYANRIAKGTFKLNGQTYTLPINNGVNSLHGGFVGFGNHVWSAAEVHSPGVAGVEMTLVSPNGDDGANVGCKCTGYPARITVHVTFTLNNGNQLGIHYDAVNDSALNTVLNLTNHSYFNLAGEASPAGSAYSQEVQINSDNYSPTDATQIPLPLPNGVPVAGTPFDFRAPHTIGSRIDDVTAPDNVPASFSKATGGESQLLIAQGYDHNWILNKQNMAFPGPDGLNLAARAWDRGSGRELAVWTDQPGVQFYSGNFLTGTLTGISGHTYRQGAGYTFETQHFPDSPNQPEFPSTELKAGGTFTSTTIFQFSS